MSQKYQMVSESLRASPKTWLITGVAGFIGSNLLERLLSLDQNVVGLDNFATGHQHNLDDVQACVTEEQWAGFKFIRGDIRDYHDCEQSLEAVDYVLHQAALGSVPRSVNDPITTNQVNIDGFLNMLTAAQKQGVESFVYAASSSTYGDSKKLPKVEDEIGKPLSPYAVTKYVNEIYADVYSRTYDFHSVGLRYFNVFGRRQDPDGAYAAVIPKWIASMSRGEPIYINGDGETSRDFCFIDNVLQANILAAVATPDARNQVYNVAIGGNTTLNQLFQIICDELQNNGINYDKKPKYRDFRAGDVRHSQADISKVKSFLGYSPGHTAKEGLALVVPWFVKNLN